MDQIAPIRSRAIDEGNIQIPLWSLPLILVVLYVCLFSGLGAIGLIGPDEPRYAAIAQAMAATHDWITPRLWGTPWFEKPVLYYWFAGAAMRVFDANGLGAIEFAARLPSALAALLVVLAVAWTAMRSYGIGAAWYATLILPTSIALIGFSRAASPDMLFAGLLTAAMAAASEILQKSRPGPGLRVAFGFFLGLSVLAKGPAAVILAGGATLLWAALSWQWQACLRFLHPLIVTVFCATALPWYILCALRNPEFLHVFIWQHNFQRYLTPVFEHRQPVWFFGYILLAALIPWVCVFFASFFSSCFSSWGRLGQKADWKSSPGLFFACWSGFTILFFSLSQSKLPGYVLPAIPPLFILLGQEIARSLEQGGRRAAWVTAFTGLLLVSIAGFSGERVLTFATRVKMVTGIDGIRYLSWALWVAAVGGLIALALSWLNRPRCALLAVVFVMLALVEIADAGILSRLSRLISARELAHSLLTRGGPAPNVAEYELPRSWEYGLQFYLGRELPQWKPEMPPPDWIVTTPEAALPVLTSGVRVENAHYGGPSTILLLRVKH